MFDLKKVLGADWDQELFAKVRVGVSLDSLLALNANDLWLLKCMLP
jgi:hypothetical protein